MTDNLFKVTGSILDTDLYKLTMQQAVLEHFPHSVVTYRFINRTPENRFTEATAKRIEASIKELKNLALTQQEQQWLKKACPYFKDEYLKFLSDFRFDPENEVKLVFTPKSESDSDGNIWGELSIDIVGIWSRAILYEVPVMYIVSHFYYTDIDTKWDYVGQIEHAKNKGLRLFKNNVLLSEFGTRRRRSYEAQKLALQGLLEARDELDNSNSQASGKLVGTSNVHFAQLLGLAPIGTIAHEWIMAIAAMEGYKGSNGRAMDLWDKTYPDGQLTIALTDTFTTGPFFEDFAANENRAKRWRGLRHDSGDPFAFIPKVKQVYESMGIDPKSKMIVFSDSLDIEKAIKLQQTCAEKDLTCSMGIGTNITNDFKHVANPTKDQKDLGQGKFDESLSHSAALNIVIKIREIEGNQCIKLSEDVTKHTGQSSIIDKVVKELNL